MFQGENQRIQGLLKMYSEENERMIERESSSEVDKWKAKFCELNKDYHQLQEQMYR